MSTISTVEFNPVTTGTIFFFTRKSSWVIHSIRESQGTLFFFFICQDWPEQARKTPYAIHSKFVGVKRRITYFLTKWVVFFHVYLDIFCVFFLLEKVTLFRMSFYSISNHSVKKKTPREKNSFFIHSIDFTQKGVENDLFREKKRYLC